MATEQKVLKVGAENQYFDFIKHGIFKIQCCDACQKTVFIPREFCVHCGNTELSWFRPNGYGVVYASTVVRAKDPDLNRNIAVVDLDEGVRLMSEVVGVSPESVRIGARVKLKIVGALETAKVVFETV